MAETSRSRKALAPDLFPSSTSPAGGHNLRQAAAVSFSGERPSFRRASDISGQLHHRRSTCSRLSRAIPATGLLPPVHSSFGIPAHLLGSSLLGGRISSPPLFAPVTTGQPPSELPPAISPLLSGGCASGGSRRDLTSTVSGEFLLLHLFLGCYGL